MKKIFICFVRGICIAGGLYLSESARGDVFSPESAPMGAAQESFSQFVRTSAPISQETLGNAMNPMMDQDEIKPMHSMVDAHKGSQIILVPKGRIGKVILPTGLPHMKPPINLQEIWATTIAPKVALMTADQQAIVSKLFAFFKNSPTENLGDFKKSLTAAQKAVLDGARKMPAFQDLLKSISQDLVDTQVNVMANTWWKWLKNVKDGSVGATFHSDLIASLEDFFTFKLDHPGFVPADQFAKVVGAGKAQAFNNALTNPEIAKIMEEATQDVMKNKLAGSQVMWADFEGRMNGQKVVVLPERTPAPVKAASWSAEMPAKK